MIKDKLESFLALGIEEISTTFNKDTDFDGVLQFSKPLRIDGKFKGKINSNSDLIIGTDAEVKAEIKARKVIISGTVWGNIEAEEKLDILPSGKLYGNIRTAKLKIADGVIFEGNCEMLKTKDAVILEQDSTLSQKFPPKKK